jgi:hypothetical protein
MTLTRRFLFALCIALAARVFAQERADQVPNAPEMQKSGTRLLEGRKARLALLSQVSSKSPQRFFVHG